MDKPYMFPQDFNMYESDSNGIHVNLSEINKMIEYGVITVDREKLKEYKFDTTVNYNKETMTRDEAFKLWNSR